MTAFDMNTMPRTSVRAIHALAARGPCRDASDASWLAPLSADPRLLFDWLNANLPIDPRKPLTVEDVAHVSLLPHEFAQIPADTLWCPYRRIAFRRAGGIEFWCSQFALPPLKELGGLRGRIAWKPTGNTAALFRRTGKP